MEKTIKEWLLEHEDEFLKDLFTLIRIDSVRGEAREGVPFGDGPKEALEAGLKICEGYGFHTKNWENYVGTVDYSPELPHTLDILGHLDVVPAGEGWEVTGPFEPLVKGENVYGRGVSDDKGPILCALYAMRAVKELGYSLKKGVRLILGTNEETGSADLAYYYKKEKAGEMSFTPDAEFPIINIEKGAIKGTLKKNRTAKGSLLSLKAGVAVNAVPQKAVMEFSTLSEEEFKHAKDAVEKEYGVRLERSGNTVTVIGVSAHASTPHLGKNAGLAALNFAVKLPSLSAEDKEAFEAILKLFPYGVTDGSGLGIKMNDEESGDLTCTLDLFAVDNKEMSFTFDSRVPICGNKENCEDVARKSSEAKGFVFETNGMIPPHHVPKDSDFIKALLSCYEKVTGEKGECIAIGGGTYVHEVENGVAFGAILPDVDTHMHGADEWIKVKDLLLAAEIYAESILALCS